MASNVGTKPTAERNLKEKIRRSGPVVAVAQSTKRALRHYGEATSGFRPNPDFLIIGAKRGGTTSAYKYLLEHPNILSTFPTPARVKGTYYFDENFDRGSEWYLSHFPLESTRIALEKFRGTNVASGEASPYYLYHPLAAQRAHDLVPTAKIVALLRNPVERAYSNWKERRANEMEPLADFAEAIAAEPGRLAGEAERIISDPSYRSIPHRHQSYLDQGRYLPGLQRWWERYGESAVLVERSEDLYTDPQGTFDRICDHVGIPRWTLPDPKVHNAQRSSPLAPELTEQLHELLVDSVRALESALGRNMDWF